MLFRQYNSMHLFSITLVPGVKGVRRVILQKVANKMLLWALPYLCDMDTL